MTKAHLEDVKSKEQGESALAMIKLQNADLFISNKIIYVAQKQGAPGPTARNVLLSMKRQLSDRACVSVTSVHCV